MNRKQLENLPLYMSIIDDLVEDVGYTWTFVSDSDAMGSTSCCHKKIYIDTRTLTCSEDEFWSVVFHELTHAICQRTGIYPELHRQHPIMVDELHLVYIEAKIDEIAAEIMKVHFPPLKYMGTYHKLLDSLVKEVNKYNKINEKHP